MSWLFPRQPLHWLGLSFDRSLSVEDVERLLLSVMATASLCSVVFEVEFDKDQCTYRVGTRQPSRLKALLETFLPGTTVQSVVRSIGQHGCCERPTRSSYKTT